MPCYQRRTVSVDLSQAKNVAALVAALEELGSKIDVQNETSIAGRDALGNRFGWVKGKGLSITVESAARSPLEAKNGSQLRTAYGYAVVRKNARRFGWTVAAQANGSLELSRR